MWMNPQHIEMVIYIPFYLKDNLVLMLSFAVLGLVQVQVLRGAKE
jgi:hypothetical protein